jgi:hypothetical protein
MTGNYRPFASAERPDCALISISACNSCRKSRVSQKNLYFIGIPQTDSKIGHALLFPTNRMSTNWNSHTYK